VKPMGAGGGGVESSGTGLLDGDGALRWGNGSRGVRLDMKGGGSKHYTYPEHVVPPSVDNAGLFEAFLPSRIAAFFEGVNVNVMAYGQTGTGKTHTMFGTPGIMERAGRGDYGLSVHEGYGIFPRALIAIHTRARALKGCVLTCSVIELCMFGNKCLLDTTRAKVTQGLTSPEAYGVTIDRASKPPRMYGMEEIILESEEDVLRVFAAIAARNTAGTGMNDSSSRTHCFAFLKLHTNIDGGDMVRVSRFQFVDLAGSERLKDASGTTDYRDSHQAFSGMVTNYSLTMLYSAVTALNDQRDKERKLGKKAKPFSFRAYLFDLIQLLSESMTGSAYTAVFVCVSQAPANASQTALALNFGSAFARLTVKGRVVKPVSLAGEVNRVRRVKAEAQRALAGTTSAKYVNIRQAQKLDAEQTLKVLTRLSHLD